MISEAAEELLIPLSLSLSLSRSVTSFILTQALRQIKSNQIKKRELLVDFRNVFALGMKLQRIRLFKENETRTICEARILFPSHFCLN